MLFRRILPCQLWHLHMWEFNLEGPRTLQRFFDTTHEEIWKLLFKAQKTWPKKTEDIDGMDADEGDDEEPAPIWPWNTTLSYDVYMVDAPNTTRKRAIDGIDTNGAPDMWCAISI